MVELIKNYLQTAPNLIHVTRAFSGVLLQREEISVTRSLL